MRKIFKIIPLLTLTIFSFYYTNKVTNFIKKNDPIMKNILNYHQEFENKPHNGTIIDESYILGSSGKTIDINSSYQNMKRINAYNESLYVYKIIKPDININDNQDKFIIKGPTTKREVSLIITINDNDLINETLEIINEKNTTVSFNINLNYLRNKSELIKSITKNNLILNNDTNILNLATVFELKIKVFCFTDKTNTQLKKWCHKNNIYTIMPSITINNSITTLKDNLNNGSIIMIDLKKDNINLLSIIINYIKQKGYNIISLENLIKE